MNNIEETNPKIRAGKYKRTREDLINELSERNPTVEIVGEYVNTQIPIRCRCRTCGTEWLTNRDHLILRKQGCPVCNSPKRPVINLDTGDTYESASEAARKMGVTMSAIRAACIGKSKICRGFHWAYI